MDESRSDTHAQPDAGKPGATPAPDLGESMRHVRDAGREGLRAATDAAKALRVLISADLSLARSAFGRALAFTGATLGSGEFWETEGTPEEATRRAIVRAAAEIGRAMP